MAKHGLNLRTKKEICPEPENSKAVSKNKKEKKREEVVSVAPKVSNRLLETLEKRKQEKNLMKPKGRRGRKPKNMSDYTPQHNDYDNYSVENDYGGLEYDTGIKAGKANDDQGFGFDRGESFDEELNFDW